MKESWLFFALGSALFAGLTAILGKVGVSGINSNLATVIRTVVILGFATALVSVRGEWSGLGGASTRTWTFLVLSGLATGASWVCYFRALKLGPASQVAPVDKFSLVLVAVFAFAFLGERPSLRDWCGIAMVAGGVLLLALKR